MSGVSYDTITRLDDYNTERERGYLPERLPVGVSNRDKSRPRGLHKARTAMLRLLRLQRFRQTIEDKLPPKFGSDLRSLGPIHTCPCGSTVFKTLVSFEDYEIVWWFLDGECLNCGNLVRIPCPIDKSGTL